jgi:hypothetical protein
MTTKSVQWAAIQANEAQLLNDLNDFNSKYAKYVYCTDTTITDDAKKLFGCSISDSSNNEVNTAYDMVIQDISSSELLISNLPGVLQTNQVADASFNEIKQKHLDVDKLRHELEAKLKELHATDDTLAYEQKRIYDRTMYTSLLWTVLATTTLFYVFKNL